MNREARRSRARMTLLAVSGIAVVALLIASRAVLLPFVLALVVAYVLTPAVTACERARIPRWVAILLVYALAIGTVSVSVSLMVPRLVAEGRALGAEWPRLTATVREKWYPAIDRRLAALSGRPVEELAASPPAEERPAPVHIGRLPDGSYEVRFAEGVQLREKRDGVWHLEQSEERRSLSTAAMVRGALDKAAAYFGDNSAVLLRFGRELIAGVTRGIFTLVMTLMLGGYMILTRERILEFLRELVLPGKQASFEGFLRRLDRGLSGVVRGQLLICLVNGVLTAIGFWILGLKYWPILSIVAGVMSLIPIFGSILSSVPAVAIGLTQSVPTAVGALAWIVGIHQLEANFLNPKIIGDSAKIHPVLVVFSLIVGEHFFQLVGALFAVPCLSIAQSVFLHFLESTRPEQALAPGAPAASAAPSPPEATAAAP